MSEEVEKLRAEIENLQTYIEEYKALVKGELNALHKERDDLHAEVDDLKDLKLQLAERPARTEALEALYTILFLFYEEDPPEVDEERKERVKQLFVQISHAMHELRKNTSVAGPPLGLAQQNARLAMAEYKERSRRAKMHNVLNDTSSALVLIPFMRWEWLDGPITDAVANEQQVKARLTIAEAKKLRAAFREIENVLKEQG